MLTSILSISLGAILINNFIFSQFLGCCPFLGCSSKVDTAVGMGLAVTFVMGLASAICWVVDEYVLMPLGLAFLQTLTFILVIAALVQFVEMFLKKSIPSLYSALGIYLPLITTNCAVLGVVLLNVQNKYNFIESTVYGITGGLGFLLAIVLFASVRERVEFAEYPKSFEGFPICLVTASLLALAFMGLAVTFVMGLASAICWVVDEYVLMPLGLAFLQTLTFILVIAALVQFVEMFLKKSIPSLYSALGIYLPLITTNCAVLGVVLLNVQNKYNFIESTVYGITGGLGFLLAIVLFASVRERVEFAEYPKSFEGFPICLVTASLLALAFMGFSGMKIF